MKLLYDFLSSFEKETLFAVRSSAAEEDAQTHSFAGLFDTFLNVSVVAILSVI